MDFQVCYGISQGANTNQTNLNGQTNTLRRTRMQNKYKKDASVPARERIKKRTLSWQRTGPNIGTTWDGCHFEGFRSDDLSFLTI